MPTIKHIWFDFSDTLAFTSEEHNKLLYKSYADIVGKEVSPALIQEFKDLYAQYKSNSAVFTNGLGLPAGYWAKCVESANPTTLYKLIDSKIPDVLDRLRSIVPISIFSNMRMDKMLPAICLDKTWFAHFLSGAEFKNPKPALDGFYKIIEVSSLPPENILFIGDSIKKEIIPAKTVGMLTGLVWSESPEADYSFKNFEEIFELVKHNF